RAPPPRPGRPTAPDAGTRRRGPPPLTPTRANPHRTRRRRSPSGSSTGPSAREREEIESQPVEPFGLANVHQLVGLRHDALARARDLPRDQVGDLADLRDVLLADDQQRRGPELIQAVDRRGRLLAPPGVELMRARS